LVSAPRIMIPGKTFAPVPGVGFALPAAVEDEPDVALFEVANPRWYCWLQLRWVRLCHRVPSRER
jgi:hypothetical protein